MDATGVFSKTHKHGQFDFTNIWWLGLLYFSTYRLFTLS